MKKIFLLLSYLIFLASAISAQDCKFSENEKDEFTKSIKIETKAFKMSNGMFKAARMAFRKVNEKYYVYFEYTPANTSVIEGDYLMFKTENDLIIKAVANKTTTPNFSKYGSSISLYYSIKKEDLLAISENNISKLRIYFRDSYSDFDVSQKNAQTIKQNSKCIINAALSE